MRRPQQLRLITLLTVAVLFAGVSGHAQQRVDSSAVQLPPSLKSTFEERKQIVEVVKRDGLLKYSSDIATFKTFMFLPLEAGERPPGMFSGEPSSYPRDEEVEKALREHPRLLVVFRQCLATLQRAGELYEESVAPGYQGVLRGSRMIQGDRQEMFFVGVSRSQSGLSGLYLTNWQPGSFLVTPADSAAPRRVVDSWDDRRDLAATCVAAVFYSGYYYFIHSDGRVDQLGDLHGETFTSVAMNAGHLPVVGRTPVAGDLKNAARIFHADLVGKEVRLFMESEDGTKLSSVKLHIDELTAKLEPERQLRGGVPHHVWLANLASDRLLVVAPLANRLMLVDTVDMRLTVVHGAPKNTNEQLIAGCDALVQVARGGSAASKCGYGEISDSEYHRALLNRTWQAQASAGSLYVACLDHFTGKLQLGTLTDDRWTSLPVLPHTGKVANYRIVSDGSDVIVLCRVRMGDDMYAHEAFAFRDKWRKLDDWAPKLSAKSGTVIAFEGCSEKEGRLRVMSITFSDRSGRMTSNQKVYERK